MSKDLDSVLLPEHGVVAIVTVVISAYAEDASRAASAAEKVKDFIFNERSYIIKKTW